MFEVEGLVSVLIVSINVKSGLYIIGAVDLGCRLMCCTVTHVSPAVSVTAISPTEPLTMLAIRSKHDLLGTARSTVGPVHGLVVVVTALASGPALYTPVDLRGLSTVASAVSPSLALVVPTHCKTCMCKGVVTGTSAGVASVTAAVSAGNSTAMLTHVYTIH